ncbi:hypothetical protein Droror1_Dr00027446, partial [Drosera rotundifolia]
PVEKGVTSIQESIQQCVATDTDDGEKVEEVDVKVEKVVRDDKVKSHGRKVDMKGIHSNTDDPEEHVNDL